MVAVVPLRWERTVPGEEKKRDRRIALPFLTLILTMLLTPIALLGASQSRVVELRVPGHALLFGRVPPSKKDYYDALPTPNVVWGYTMNSSGVDSGHPYVVAWW
jgi:hypothetical protein